MGSTLSVILATSNRPIHAELALAAWAAQRRRSDFELVVVDESEGDETRAMVERQQSKLSLHYLRQPPAGRAAAYNRGMREAQGERVVLVDEGRIVAGDYVAQLCDGGDDAIVGPRRGVLAVWQQPLWGVGFARLVDIMRENPQLGGELDDAPRPLFEAADVERDVEALLARFRVVDQIEERVGPLMTPPAPRAMPWLLAIAGGLSVPRRAALEVGGFDERVRGWGCDDPELAYRLHQQGMRFRVAPLVSGQQPRGDARTLADAFRHFAERHDPVDAWLLSEFVDGRNARELEAIAASRRPGTAAERELAALTRELTRRRVQELG
jgi:GT2 family glycosyltransferase